MLIYWTREIKAKQKINTWRLSAVKKCFRKIFFFNNFQRNFSSNLKLPKKNSRSVTFNYHSFDAFNDFIFYISSSFNLSYFIFFFFAFSLVLERSEAGDCCEQNKKKKRKRCWWKKNASSLTSATKRTQTPKILLLI